MYNNGTNLSSTCQDQETHLSPLRRRRNSPDSSSGTVSHHDLDKITTFKIMSVADTDYQAYKVINQHLENESNNIAETPHNSNSLNSFQLIQYAQSNTDNEEGADIDDEDALLISKVTGGQDEDNTDENAETRIIGEETFWSISVQVFIPFIIGFGMVGAGVVLDIVQHWPVFLKVPEVFILVPALLGLKGNLEMTLASRLSTQANLGNMESAKSKWDMTLGNLSLIQCQAIVIGFLASIFAVTLGWVPNGNFDIDHALILCTSSVMTASIASFCLGLIMVSVVLISRYVNINPDNISTPIAASLGDLTTLSLLACISTYIHDVIENHTWVAPLILTIYLVSMSVWINLAKQNKLTEKVLYTGWTPVLSAMVISSCGGLILDYTVKIFKGIAVFQPVISGVGGNLVAVQASRLSTYLHSHSHLGILPDKIPKICINPVGTFFGKGEHAMTARALLLMVIPGHVIFTYIISYIQAGHTSVTLVFLVFYLLAALIQVSILLYLCEVLIFFLWKSGVDPDDHSIPYLTALGDLIGSALLALAFYCLYLVGDHDSDLGD